MTLIAVTSSKQREQDEIIGKVASGKYSRPCFRCSWVQKVETNRESGADESTARFAVKSRHGRILATAKTQSTHRHNFSVTWFYRRGSDFCPPTPAHAVPRFLAAPINPRWWQRIVSWRFKPLNDAGNREKPEEIEEVEDDESMHVYGHKGRVCWQCNSLAHPYNRSTVHSAWKRTRVLKSFATRSLLQISSMNPAEWHSSTYTREFTKYLRSLDDALNATQEPFVFSSFAREKKESIHQTAQRAEFSYRKIVYRLNDDYNEDDARCDWNTNGPDVASRKWAH